MNKETNISASHQKIVDLLNSHGYRDHHKGIQLFANQYDKAFGISIDYNGTGLHINRDEIDEAELEGDELIRVCKSWTYRG